MSGCGEENVEFLKCLLSISKFPWLAICYSTKGSPFWFLINSGGYWKNPRQKLGNSCQEIGGDKNINVKVAKEQGER